MCVNYTTALRAGVSERLVSRAEKFSVFYSRFMFQTSLHCNRRCLTTYNSRGMLLRHRGQQQLTLLPSTAQVALPVEKSVGEITWPRIRRDLWPSVFP